MALIGGCTAYMIWRVAGSSTLPISLKMFTLASPKTHLRLANPRRRRKQAVNYPTQKLS
jgi:hypothetical protein